MNIKKKVLMHRKRLRWTIILLLGLSIASIQAQYTLVVKSKVDSKNPFALNVIRKLTFDSGSMTVHKKDGNSFSYLLLTIQYLNFSNDTLATALGLAVEKKHELLVYPSLADDQLHIQFTAELGGKTQLQIMDIRGRIVYQQALITQFGVNCSTVSVAHLQQGLYVCTLLNGKKSQTIKFIKK
jgi:hypothetical protein